jgi:hypothetical protein
MYGVLAVASEAKNEKFLLFQLNTKLLTQVFSPLL